MSGVILRSDVEVKLVRASAHDDYVVQAAQVSVKGENNPDTDLPRLINYLMESRHGSPFEHNSLTFFVKAPIFVFREWHRHRIASINEQSGRYSKLYPEFYTPNAERSLVNSGTSARPEFGEGTEAWQRKMVADDIRDVAELSWYRYERQLNNGIANEVARIVLPVGVYSSMYWTVNPRALMNFLSLRTDARTHGSPDAAIFSRPQREIEMGAEQIEDAFAELMPITHAAFVKHGRIAP